MGTMLSALLALQTVERQLGHVRSRLKARKNAVAAQQRRIDQLRTDWSAINDKALTRRKEADSLELDLRQRETEVAKFRAALNQTKTNKEYAAILTQINTLKADNSKIEEQVLKTMQDVESTKAEADKVMEQVKAEESRLQDIDKNNNQEVAKLTAMFDELTARRGEAAKAVSPEFLKSFERIGKGYDGEAMALIEVHGKRAPYEYICGGCFMALNAEHVNALRTRDEIRTCDNCGRILYLELETQKSRTT